MKKSQKLFSIILGILIVVTIISGCNSGSSSETTSKVNETKEAYETTCSLTKADLTYSDGDWKYKGLPFISEDQEWINSSLNKEGTVNQGAIYRKIAYLLEGLDMGLAKYTTFADILIGWTPDTRDEFLPYAHNAKTFITIDDAFINAMKKFQTLSCVEGSFDFNTNKFGVYDFTIKDTSQCAEEMQISEEMLGYILAMLEEYAPTIEFDNNSCHIEYNRF